MVKHKNIRLLSFVLFCSVVICIVKFYAFFLTNSNAILSDALESFINIIAGSFALYSVWLSHKPKDIGHPYGHGKIEFLSAGFEGGLIFLAGIVIIAKSGYNFFHPHTLSNLDLGIGLTFITGVANLLLGCLLISSGKKNNSPATSADGKHLLSDAYTSAAILMGLVIINFTAFKGLDNIVAILIGIVIIYMGFKLLRSAVAGVMDEADKRLLEDTIAYLNENRRENWVDLHNFRAIKYGADLHIDCHLTLPWYYDLREMHKEIDAFEDLLNLKHKGNVEFFIHSDPCLPPAACKICTFKDCKKREVPFEKKMEWNLKLVLKNSRHEKSFAKQN